MKRIIKLTIILAYSLAGWAQCDNTQPSLDNVCEKGKGIRTDPDNPLNCEGATSSSNLVPWRQNDFDWRPASTVREYFDYYIDGINGAGPMYKSVINPFTDPSSAEYYPHVSFGQSSNNQPADGWELMKVEFGSPDGEPDKFFPKLPYMLLYNKYSGTLRFFGVLADPHITYKTVQIILSVPRFSPGAKRNDESYYQPNLKATNLLSIQGESIQPLDQETSENSLSVFARYSNNDDMFMWFDVPLAYDPCVCQFKSQFNVFFRFVQVANVSITGDLTGSINTTTTSEGSYATKVFTRVLAAGISAGTAIATGGAVVNVKAFTDLVDIFKDNPNTSAQDKANLTKLKGALDCTADMADVALANYKGLDDKDDKKAAAAGKKILDGSVKFFSAAGKGCQPDKSATTISGRINATGTVTQTDDIGDTEILLALPGSKWDLDLEKRIRRDATTNNRLKPAYPLYNERLGTFALLKTPEISITQEIDTCSVIVNEGQGRPWVRDDLHMTSRASWSMRLTSDLEYSFNPVLDLNPDKTIILARFVVNKNAPIISPNISSALFGSFSNANDDCLPTNLNSNPLNMEFLSNSEYAIFSPYIPIDYIKSLPMRFSWKREDVHTNLSFFPPFAEEEKRFINNRWNSLMNNPSFANNVFIQFTIVAESNKAGSNNEKNQLFQILTFPVKFNNMTTDPNGSILTGNYVQSTKDFNIDETFAADTDLFFEGPVFISAKLATTNGAKLRIYSLKGFEIEPGADVSPDIELIVGPHLLKDEQPEATYTEIETFCKNSNEYKANEFSAAAIAEEKAVYEEYEKARILRKMEEDRSFKFGLKPNPTKDKATVFWDGDENPSHISVIDAAGSVLFETTLAGDAVRFHLDMTPYSTGVYNIIIISSTGKRGYQKLIKL